MIGEATKNQSGKFEVQIEGGKLAWSKKETGKFPTSKHDMDSIFASVKASL